MPLENLIILSHDNHQFINNDLNVSSKIFKNILIISPRIPSSSGYYQENVTHLSFTRFDLFISLILNLYELLSSLYLKEITKAVSRNIFCLSYARELLHYLAISKLVQKKLKYFLTSYNQKEWIILSAWYYSTAFASYQLKKKYPNIEIFSIAHAFEIDLTRSPFNLYLFRDVYHNEFTKVFFISKTSMLRYIADIANPLSLRIDNCHFSYLGALKCHKGYSKISTDNTFRVVSCSNISEIKRLDKILRVLSKTRKFKINWIHFGSGEKFIEMEKAIKKNLNTNLDINFMGHLDNCEIQSYYSRNEIDLFINLSENEGLPVSIVEAMSFGIPILAPRVGSIPEILDDSFSMLVNNSDDEESIFNMIEDYYSLATDVKKQIRSRIIDKFEKELDASKNRTDFFIKLRNKSY